jgi:uncharacterized protein YcfJ
METSSINRIHPLMAGAAVSVILVSLTGAAAITGLLPTSKGAPDAQLAALAPAGSQYLQPGAVGAPGMAPVAAPVSAPVAAAYAPPAPVVKEKPVVKRTVEKTRVVHHHHTTQVARNDAPRSYQQQPAPVAAQPSYIGIGTGAIIGGLIGNQIGGGNGKKLATVAGVIGGGMLGNEIANRNR